MRYAILTIVFTIMAAFLISCKSTSWSFDYDKDGNLLGYSYLEITGVGENKADHKNKKIENDSGFKMPFGDTSLRDVPMPR